MVLTDPVSFLVILKFSDGSSILMLGSFDYEEDWIIDYECDENSATVTEGTLIPDSDDNITGEFRFCTNNTAEDFMNFIGAVEGRVNRGLCNKSNVVVCTT